MIFKKGDKVYDYAYGWGEVCEHSCGELSVCVDFEDVEIGYHSKGCLEIGFKPTLSFTEYTLEGFSQVRPKEELPFNRWYVSELSKRLVFYHQNGWYGITGVGSWSNCKGDNQEKIKDVKGNTIATDEQILEKLSAYAASIGVKTGATFIAIDADYSVKIEDKCNEGFKYVKAMNALYFNNWLMMQDGKWVTVVVEQNSYIDSKATGKWVEFIEQRKTLEEEIQAIKKHLGI